MRGFCAFDGRGLVWLFVLVFCCCFSTTIIIYFYTINDKYITREGFTEHILPGDEGVRDFFSRDVFCFGCVAFRSPLFAPVFPGCGVRFSVRFFCFFESVRLWCSSCCDFFRVHSVFFCVGQVCSVRFPVVRRGTGVCLSVFWVAAAVSAGVRCGIRASEALFCRERENLLGTSADGSASHRSGAGCLRVWSAGLCGRQLFDSR